MNPSLLVLTSSTDPTAVRVLTLTIGTICIILGLLIFIYSFIRFQYATRRLVKGVFVADMFSPPFLMITGVTISALALALVFV